MFVQFKKRPKLEKYLKMVDQESFIRQRIPKARENLEKLRKENLEKEMTHVTYQCLMGRRFERPALMADLNYLRWLADKKIKEIHKRIEPLKKEAHSKVAPPQQ